MSGGAFQAEGGNKQKGSPYDFRRRCVSSLSACFSSTSRKKGVAGQPAIASSYSAESSSHCSSASFSLSTAMERILAFSAAFAGFFS